MNGYNFTERVRKVLAMAREEAARLHHEYVGTEHILLGLIREGEGVAAAVLQNLSVDLDEIQQKIEDTVKKGKAPQTTGPDLPYTSRAKKVLELAMARRASSLTATSAPSTCCSVFSAKRRESPRRYLPMPASISTPRAPRRCGCSAPRCRRAARRTAQQGSGSGAAALRARARRSPRRRRSIISAAT